MSRMAIYDVNDYILNGTPVGNMLGYNGSGLKPIFPVQGVPEANSQASPFITYTSRTAPDAMQWWITLDETMFMVQHQDFAKVQAVATEMLDIFKRMDDSARDINQYLGSIPRNDYTFLYFRVTGRSMPESVPQEGGRLMLPITVRYAYTINSGRDIS